MTRMSKSIAVGAALVTAVIVGAGAFGYRSKEGIKPSGAGALAQANSSASTEADGAFHMPSSADKVSVTVSISPTDSTNDNRSIAITLHIAEGWHVNANPPSLAFLIPTTVQAEISGKRVPLAVRYPSGRNSDIRLGGKSIMVYDDNTILLAQFQGGKLQAPQSAKSLTIIVTVQSCSNQGICLPPSTLKKVVRVNA